MEARSEGWNIVIIGNWNISVFSPDWVSKNLFDKLEVEVEFPLTPGLSPRYTHNGVVVFLNGDRLFVQPQSTDDISLKAAEDKAVEVLRLLPHTPIRAVGVNFKYMDPTPKSWLLSMFDFTDTQLLEQMGYAPDTREIGRIFKREDGILNLKLSLSSECSIAYNLNYHYPADCAEKAQKFLSGKVVALSHEAKALIESTYTSDI